MLNKYLDHAVLAPNLSREEASELIRLGINYKVKTVCVRPCDIDLAVEMCKGTETMLCCGLGFPHGNICTESKLAEAELYCKKGVAEIDMVANYGWIRSGLWDEVLAEIKSIVDIAHRHDLILKVIFETGHLNLEQIAKSTEICIQAKADFVKTSTGFYGEGASEEVVDCMIKIAAGRIKVKPSGGIRDAEKAQMFINMGAARLGVNGASTPAICGENAVSAAKGWC